MSDPASVIRLETVRAVLKDRLFTLQSEGEAFAPANIALCKYWGKRHAALNLPRTSSLSLSLGTFGTTTRLVADAADAIVLNGEPVDENKAFAKRLFSFLDLFRGADGPALRIETENTVPTGAGLASSASGFAALVRAIDHACGWNLGGEQISILARLGSGSASRSVYDGFVVWHAGVREDGMDSFAEPLETTWPGLCLAVAMVSSKPKQIGSREAMIRTVETSHLYQAWPDQAVADLQSIREAITQRDFDKLGQVAEENALAMHATMMASRPPVAYWLPESVSLMQEVWGLRAQGLSIYFTMDAGPNLKLIYEKSNEDAVLSAIPCDLIAVPF